MDPRLEQHRAELTGYCYRMLGSLFEAEDAVQETLLRAWQKYDTYDESRGSLRTWLFTIATNICLDLLRGAKRRARAMDLGPAARPGAQLGEPLPPDLWVFPVPDDRVLPDEADPAELAVRRETIRLAFIAALQHLPPRQRAVLILRDVLCWSAAETASLLEGTPASVNSALQRARATLREVDTTTSDPYRPDDEQQRKLLARYCEAFEQYDVETLVSLLHEDATTTMPPFAWWLSGRDAIREVLLASGQPCKGARMVPTVANGQPAFAVYWPDGAGGYRPFSLEVLDISGGLITGSTTYLDGELLLPHFGTTPPPGR